MQITIRRIGKGAEMFEDQEISLERFLAIDIDFGGGQKFHISFDDDNLRVGAHGTNSQLEVAPVASNVVRIRAR